MKMTRSEWRAIARETANIRRNEGRVAAIRYLRERVGCGLQQAYDAVGRLEAVDWSKV